MSAWVSDAMSDTTLVLDVITDIARENSDRSIEAEHLHQLGQPVPAELCPNKSGSRILSGIFQACQICPGHRRTGSSPRARLTCCGSSILGRSALSRGGGHLSERWGDARPGGLFLPDFGSVKQAFLSEDTPKKLPFGVAGLPQAP